MSQNGSNESDQLLSADTRTTAVFVALGLVLWYGSTTVTESQPVQFAVLLGVGVIAPTLLNQRRG